MAVPAIVGRRASGSSVAEAFADVSAEPYVRRFAPGRGYTLLLLALLAAALLSRVFTTNSLAGEPTSDEYLYGVHARELARGWVAGQPVVVADLGVEGRSVVIESAALSLILPWDPITIGRTMQALFNALCVPMTFVLARQIGLTRSAAFIGALLLMAVPEFQELAWRFWTDSQATLFSLVYLSALIAFIRRPSVIPGGIGIISLGLLLLTKESAAVTFAPFLAIAVAVALSRRLTSSARLYAALAVGLIVMAFIGLGFLVARAPSDLAHNALLEKTFGAGPLVLGSVRAAIPAVPAYLQHLVKLIGPVELGSGFLWATLLGFTFLVAQSAVALYSLGRFTPWVAGWLFAALAWIPGALIPWQDLASLQLTDAWVTVAAGALLVAVGTLELYLRNSHRTGWGLALLGLVVAAVLAERLIISVTPKVSAAALTFRSLMPIVPLLAALAGCGVWAAAGAIGLLVPAARWARPTFAVIAAAILVTFWSPLVRERLTSHPLLGRIADRGADPDTPQGLRVQVLVDAQPWLQENIRPSDMTIAGVGIPRQLAWYADLGVEGMDDLIDLGSQPSRTAEERRQYVLDRFGPHGAAYVVDFNVDWMDPGGERARQWRQTYETLSSLQNVEVAYLVRDKYGYPVFYVMRNHGYVVVGH